MNNLQKSTKSFILKWVSSYSSSVINFRSSRINLCPVQSHNHIAQSLRLYRTGVAELSGNLEKEKASRMPLYAREDAQVALRDYLHCTRNLEFPDAEYMSKNSPGFLSNLLRKVDNNGSIGRSLTKFLWYHPINEFEPFFESMGLKPSEVSSFLPRELMFLNDEPMLMECYHCLCNYGVPRNKIGKIYRVVPEVFRYGNAVLLSNLKSIENVGLDRNVVIKLVISSPNVLVEDEREDFFRILEKLKNIGISQDWIEGHLLEGGCYHWSSILELLCFFSMVGCTDEQLSSLIMQHPDLLFAGSGRLSFSIFVFLMKFGYTRSEIYTLLMQFPEIPVDKFLSNLRYCYVFLVEIEMAVPDIQSLVCSHGLLLGTCFLKKASTIHALLATGWPRMRKTIMENPEVLKNWVRGEKIKRIPIPQEDVQSQMMKTKFLLDLGFVEKTKEMDIALKVFRGKGNELQERYDCLVAAGLDAKEVSKMVRNSPQILNQSKNVIETKISILVNDLGYPLSNLIKFPSFLNYNVQRVKLRISMYLWLKSMKLVDPNLALSTILASSETIFKKTYVNLHPKGPQIWESLKQNLQNSI